MDKKIFYVLLVILSSAAHGDEPGQDPAAVLAEKLPGVLDMLHERKQQMEQALQLDAVAEPQAHAPLVSQLPEIRDPFATSVTINRRLNAAAPQQFGNAQQFQPAVGLQRLPKLKVRGIVSRNKGEAPLALLEVGNDTVHLVRAGDEISFSAGDPSQVIRIQSIKRLSVVVEVGSLRDVVVVR